MGDKRNVNRQVALQSTMFDEQRIRVGSLEGAEAG